LALLEALEFAIIDLVLEFVGSGFRPLNLIDEGVYRLGERFECRGGARSLTERGETHCNGTFSMATSKDFGSQSLGGRSGVLFESTTPSELNLWHNSF
jgi:hypothetical protein